MKLSIVASLYQSAPYVVDFYQRVTAVAQRHAGHEYEIILVNDGSPDNVLDILIDLLSFDSHLVVVDLSRNFGHHQAMMRGLSCATGEKIFLLDSDLEEEPEWLSSFQLQMEIDASDVVYGVQHFRRGGVIERLTGIIFYRLFRFFTGLQQPDNIVTARLMSRRYVQALLLHSEREINIGGLFILTGFKQSIQLVKKHSSSPTTYTFARKIGHLVNAITSFSGKPLIIAFYTGMLISVSAIIFIFYLALRYFYISAPPDGYTSLITSIWLFSGLIIFFLGVQGIYIAKLFLEVKQRPSSIIREIYRAKNIIS